VDENIGTIGALDKAVPLAGIEPLNRSCYTFAHFYFSLHEKKTDMDGERTILLHRGLPAETEEQNRPKRTAVQTGSYETQQEHTCHLTDGMLPSNL
jgi:hypothetical protein